MKLIVLGGNGFIGNRLSSMFRRIPEWEVVTFGSANCDLTNGNSVEFLKNNITEDSVILFCSTISRVKDDSIAAFYKNVKMAENVALALAGVNFKKIIFLSSIDIFGRPPKENPITESSPYSPAGYYGYSKLMSEFILLDKIKPPTKLAILRLPGVVSLDMSDPSALGSIFRDLSRNNTVFLSGGGVHLRTFLHVDELYQFINLIVMNDWYGKVNLSTNITMSLFDMVTRIKEILNSKSQIVSTEKNGSEFDIVISNEYSSVQFPAIKYISLEDSLLSDNN